MIDPLINAILDNPMMKKVIDNPIIDDTHTIPNSWGGSTPLDNPVTYLDKDFPKSMMVNGVTFDTAEPAVVHENIEQFAMTAMMKGGMNRETALKVGFWHFGEPAEDAWYRSHGIDPKQIEPKYTPILNRIAARKADNIPKDLFKDTYPDGDPKKATVGPIGKPTAKEVQIGRTLVERYLNGLNGKT